MKTPIAQVNILYALLSVSALKNAITGDVYRNERPVGSTFEDVVINPLPVNGDQFQLGTANVNIYVPDLKLVIGSTEQLMTNDARLEELTDIATPLLQEKYTQQYLFLLENITLIAEPETGYHFMNLRIGFQFIPTL